MMMRCLMMMMMRCLMSFRSEENYGVRGKGVEKERKKRKKNCQPAKEGFACLSQPLLHSLVSGCLCRRHFWEKFGCDA